MSRWILRPTFAVVIVFSASLILLTAVPAHAATVQTTMQSSTFSPAATAGVMGSTFTWKNNDPFTHSTTQNVTLLGGWNQDVAPLATSTGVIIRYAGTYGYYCRFHGTPTSGMRGSIVVPMIASPSSGTTATTYTLRFGSAALPSGFVYDLRMRKDAGSWMTFSGLTTESLRFNPGTGGQGTYQFRSRIRRTSDGKFSGYSPVRSVVVS